MAQGDIRPGSPRVQPGADPQVMALEYLASLPSGDEVTVRRIAGNLDVDDPKVRYALKQLGRCGLVKSRPVQRPAGRRVLLWGLTDKGRTAVLGR